MPLFSQPLRRAGMEVSFRLDAVYRRRKMQGCNPPKADLGRYQD
jgi:hypothetical protein